MMRRPAPTALSSSPTRGTGASKYFGGCRRSQESAANPGPAQLRGGAAIRAARGFLVHARRPRCRTLEGFQNVLARGLISHLNSMYRTHGERERRTGSRADGKRNGHAAEKRYFISHASARGPWREGDIGPAWCWETSCERRCQSSLLLVHTYCRF